MVPETLLFGYLDPLGLNLKLLLPCWTVLVLRKCLSGMCEICDMPGPPGEGDVRASARVPYGLLEGLLTGSIRATIRDTTKGSVRVRVLGGAGDLVSRL